MDKRALDTHCVDLVYSLLPLVSLPLHPVSVQICEQSIKIVSTCSVSIPFGGIVS